MGITLSLTGIYMECPAKMTVFGWIPVPGRHGVNRLQVVTSRVKQSNSIFTKLNVSINS